MRPAKLNDREMFRRLADVFRQKGYDGASYADLMDATGLVKASLYHRFPGGKEQMVDAILSDVDRQFSERILSAALEHGDPYARARRIAKRIREFYRGGTNWCLLDTLTLSASRSTLAHACRSMEAWIEAFTRIGKEAGLSPGVARKRAEEAVAAIEGGLVVARALRNAKPFLRALGNFPRLLTGGTPDPVHRSRSRTAGATELPKHLSSGSTPECWKACR